MPEYKLVTYASDHGGRAGMMVDGTVIDLAGATGHPGDESLLAVVRDWDAAQARLDKAAERASAFPAVTEPRLLAPLPQPGTVFCAGANYADHVAEMARAHGQDAPPDPHTLGLKAWHFIKNTHAVTGPDAQVAIPRRSKKLDWEAELALVIGRRAKDVSEADAFDYVAGYMNANDLSARDLGPRPGLPAGSPFAHDWIAHKSFDGSCPTGPWLVPAKFVARPEDLSIECLVNGALKQSSNTGEMIYGIAEQIAHLSERMTLWPGDVILTGTPAGVGNGRNEFLQPGDQVTVRVAGLGELTNVMVAAE